MVFYLLKALMLGYRLWGVESGLKLTELADFLRTTEARAVALVMYLAEEGLVALDDRAGAVRLTEQGACNLLAESHSHSHHPREV